MDFGRSPDEAAFAEEVRAFLRAHPADSFPVDGTDAGYGSGAHSRAFMRALGERGWLSLTWPRAHGGQERPMGFVLVLLEELAAAGAPFGPLSGCLQVSESIIRHGSATLQREILPGVARGETIGRATASRARDRTCSRSRPARASRASTGCWTAARSGRATRASRPTAPCSRAPIPRRPVIAASAC